MSQFIVYVFESAQFEVPDFMRLGAVLTVVGCRSVLKMQTLKCLLLFSLFRQCIASRPQQENQTKSSVFVNIMYIKVPIIVYYRMLI